MTPVRSGGGASQPAVLANIRKHRLPASAVASVTQRHPPLGACTGREKRRTRPAIGACSSACDLPSTPAGLPGARAAGMKR